MPLMLLPVLGDANPWARLQAIGAMASGEYMQGGATQIQARWIYLLPRHPLEMSSDDFSLSDLAEQFIAERKLPNEAIQWLTREYQSACDDSGVIVSPSIAPVNIAEDLDLPTPSTWLEVMATILDAIVCPGQQTHLAAMRDCLPSEVQA